MLELGLLLAGLSGLLLVIGVPYLLISHARLKARVAALEAARLKLQQPAGTQADPVAEDKHAGTGPWGRAPATGGPEESREIAPQAAQTRLTDDTAENEELPGTGMPSETLSGPAEGQPQSPPRAFVLRQDTFDALNQWLRENWVLAAGAASLALAGIFMVQYGAERGLLTPFWRVMAALGFGAALIAGGETVRRRYGDETEGSVQYLPSALAGAGLIALFSAILAARAMYGLLTPGSAFAALCLVSVLAMVLGWFYGPLLSALGIAGASAAPFLVGGKSDAPWVLYYYFSLIAAAGLAIDTVKRWAWISVLALAAALSAGLLLYLSGAGDLHFLMSVLLTVIAAVVLPERSLIPGHAGASVLDMLRLAKGQRVYPEFPTRLAAAAVCAATAAAVLVVLDAGKAEEVYLGLGALLALLLAAMVWMRKAPALYDLALLPGLAILAVPLIEAAAYGPMFREFMEGANRPPESAAPMTAWLLISIGGLGTVLAFLRMQQAGAASAPEGGTPLIWALAAAVYAPTMMLLLEFLWQPAQITGAYPWALAAIALAALMTLLAERTARSGSADQLPLRTALFAIAALTLISLAIFLLLAKTALTLALAVMVLLTVLIDRKFGLPALGIFAQIGAAAITYRLVIDPGVPWASDFIPAGEGWVPAAPFSQVLLAYIGTLILLSAAWFSARSIRPKTGLVLESTVATITAVFFSVLIIRLISEPGANGHADTGLMAAVWAASMVNQLYRLQSSGRFTLWLRGGLAAVYGTAALLLLAVLFVDANPLVNADEQILGPPILDSIAAAFLPLSAVFAAAAWKIRHFGKRVQYAFAVLCSLFAACYAALEIRRLWRGRDLSVPGITDPELYTYTVAILVTSATVLTIAFWRRSDSLRKIAMAGVALTIAKVFLVDMSGLSGLIRVFSFMGLGLALVGLAWINRIMTAQWTKDRKTDGSSSPPPD